MTYVWVVEDCIGADFPRVIRYAFVETTKSGSVRIRDAFQHERLIRKVIGRFFFFDDASLEKWLRRRIEASRDRVKHLLAAYEEELNSGKSLAGAWYRQTAGDPGPPWERPTRGT